jgi:hypothetical protein
LLERVHERRAQKEEGPACCGAAQSSKRADIATDLSATASSVRMCDTTTTPQMAAKNASQHSFVRAAEFLIYPRCAFDFTKSELAASKPCQAFYTKVMSQEIFFVRSCSITPTFALARNAAPSERLL